MNKPLEDKPSGDDEPHFVDMLASVNCVLVRRTILALLDELRFAHREHFDDIENPRAEREAQQPGQRLRVCVDERSTPYD